jgi:hypothetical protein
MEELVLLLRLPKIIWFGKKYSDLVRGVRHIFVLENEYIFLYNRHEEPLK